MTNTDLIAAVAEKAGLSKKDADAAVGATFETITEMLAKGDKIQLVGFGTFATKERPARVCMNPATKQEVKVPAKTVPVFKTGKALKDAVAK